MAYTRTYTIDASPSGDTVKAAIATKLDGDLTDIYTNLTTHEAMTTNAHGVGSGTIVGTATTDTLTNKTLSSPTLTGTLSGGTISGVTMTATITASGATIVSPTITGGSAVNMTIETPTLTGTLTLTSPTLTGTIDASGATIESPTITNGTINVSTLSSPTITGTIDASGATISSPTITGATLSNPTLTGTITGISTSGGGGGSVTQTVLSGKTSSGLPAFITDPNDGLKVSIDGTPTPVVISFANGYDATGQLSEIGAIKTDTEIASLTDSTTNYLYAERNSGTGAITLGAVTVAPVYQNTAPSHAANLYWFSIPEMKMYLSNGSNTWTEKQVVFLGQATCAGSQVTEIVNYAFRGIYIGALGNVPATNAYYSANHFLGVKPNLVFIEVVNKSTQGGYSAGDACLSTIYTNGTTVHPLSLRYNHLSAGVYMIDTYYAGIRSISDGALMTCTDTYWYSHIIALRGW